ncbi:MAG: hypothetical protein ACRC26_00285 [Bacteroidales bacterium]
MNTILDWIESAFQFLKEVWSEIIEGIVSFVHHVVGWFRELMLDKKKHVPFIGKMDEFKSALKNAPVKNAGIFEGVYNEETDQIEHIRYLDADDLDTTTKQVLGDQPLVVLN